MGKPIDVSCGRYVSFRLPTVTAVVSLDPGSTLRRRREAGRRDLQPGRGMGTRDTDAVAVAEAGEWTSVSRDVGDSSGITFRLTTGSRAIIPLHRCCLHTEEGKSKQGNSLDEHPRKLHCEMKGSTGLERRGTKVERNKKLKMGPGQSQRCPFLCTQQALDLASAVIRPRGCYYGCTANLSRSRMVSKDFVKASARISILVRHHVTTSRYIVKSPAVSI